MKFNVRNQRKMIVIQFARFFSEIILYCSSINPIRCQIWWRDLTSNLSEIRFYLDANPKCIALNSDLQHKNFSSIISQKRSRRNLP